MQHRRAKHQDIHAALVQMFARLKFPTKFPFKDFFCKTTQFSFQYLEMKEG